MKRATSIPPARAEQAMHLADELEAHCSAQAALARTLGDELELTGELPKDFVSRMEELMEKQRNALAALIDLSAAERWRR